MAEDRSSWRFKRSGPIQTILGNQGFNLFLFFLAVYFFIIGVKLMGSGFKLMGKDFSQELIASTSNPVVGLAIGIFATALVQSSSATTSMVVTMVLANPGFYPNAIPIVMGANIGTSVTNVIVSLSHIRNAESFRRAFSGALVHDFFNLLSVLLLFPIELLVRELTGKGILERVAYWAAGALLGKKGVEFELIDHLLRPLLEPITELISTIGMHEGVVTLIVGTAILFAALVLITRSARRAIEGRVQKVLDRYLFKNDATSFSFGLLLTTFVQSSSVTTSLVVPLVGGGILSIYQIYPYSLGANIGTTITALLAALATLTPCEGSKMALSISLVHLFFNMCGILIFYPLRKVPITLARWTAEYMSWHRKWAILFIIVVFFGIPGMVILMDRFIF
ncbi:MAG: Na/Pi symporter [Candidatus Thermoplasmatota archaeon]|nr:Na/Pi symporter [Candidatus Thermoplasmatota archaeon]